MCDSPGVSNLGITAVEQVQSVYRQNSEQTVHCTAFRSLLSFLICNRTLYYTYLFSQRGTLTTSRLLISSFSAIL